jgi:lipoprotein-releasing system permease protein
MTAIAFCGIAIGTFALALVSAVMSGFEYEVHKKLRGIHAPIIMQSYGNGLNASAIKNVIKEEFPTINAVSAGSNGYGIVYTPDSDAAPDVVLMRGIEPQWESAVSGMNHKILGDEKNIENLLGENHVIIGKKLAENLALKVGDPMEIAYASQTQKRKNRLSLDTKTVIISALFDSGIDEFDNSVVFCSLEFLETMFPEIGIQTIRIATKENIDQKKLIADLEARFKLYAYSWQDLYPALVSALKLEKYAMFLILALITLVASMSIVSLLFMRITQKRGDIAILKAMGASHAMVVRIFLIVGSIITLSACVTGLIMAALASWILKTYPLIELPDTYYVSHLPVHFTWQLTAIVALLVTVIGILASWIPAHKTRDINISHVLRFEN